MNAPRPVLFCLHYLGGSASEWNRFAQQIDADVRVIAVDLPGFGDAAHTSGFSVAEMSETIAARIAAESPRRWMIAGHSMGAKVAAAIARRAEDGDARLAGLIGIITVAGSPPSPEPMPDADRATMLSWFHGDDARNRGEAEIYIANNSVPQLDAASRALAVDDVLRMHRGAWTAWLERGSREDWSERIGTLKTPALVIAGADDANLGPNAQHRLMMPHFSDVRYAEIPHAKHLLPLEASTELAQLFREHLLRANYGALIASNRVGSITRNALRERGRPDNPGYAAQALTDDALQILRAVVARIVPQPNGSNIDLAARIDRQLAARIGDGWRFADLPSDAAAYQLALVSLDAASVEKHGTPFTTLDAKQQYALLNDVAHGAVSIVGDGTHLNAKQLQHWFEDVRGDATTVYVSHPDTRARMGLSGIANGGDGTAKSGFTRTGLDEREAWEPVAATETAR